jgi:hypothetical protein
MRWFAITLVASLSTVVGLNIQTDLAGLRNGDIRGLARHQAPGVVLASALQFDQRRWIEGRLDAGCPAWLLTGSSTVGRISSDMFVRPGLLNAWLSGPTLEDFEALTQLLMDKHCHPHAVLFGVDAFLFNPQLSDSRWRSWQDLQLRFLHDDGWFASEVQLAKRSWLEFKDLLSYQTTRDSLLQRMRGQPPETEVVHYVRDIAAYCRSSKAMPSLRHTDGHFSWCPALEPSPSEVEHIARSYLERNVHSMASFAELDRSRLRRLAVVLDRLRDVTDQIVLFSPPYHPTTYALLQHNAALNALLGELDQTLEQLADHNHARYLALRDPAILACDAALFSDSHHSQPECSARLAEAVSAALK